MSKKERIIFGVIFILLFLYVYKVNEISIDYRLHLKEERKKEEKREKEFKKLKAELTKKIESVKKEYVYNKCVYGKIPKVTGMLETAQYLRFTNSSFIRFGNSELDILMKKNDFKQYYDKKLEEKLSEAWFNNNPNVMIGVPNAFDGFPKLIYYTAKWWASEYEGTRWMYNNMNFSKQYFDAFVSSVFTCTYNTSCELVNLVYDNMKEVFRDKDLVILRGNNSEVYDYDVYEYARSQKTFFAPPRNAWDKYDELKETLMKEDPNAIYVIAIGITSEILVMDLVKEGRRAMDLGHLAKDYDYYKKQKFDWDFYG